MRETASGFTHQFRGILTKGIDGNGYRTETAPVVNTSESEVDSQAAQETGHVAVNSELDEEGFNKNVSKYRD